MDCGFKTGRVFIRSLSLVFVSYGGRPRRAGPVLLASHLHVLLHAELRQGLFDAQGRQSGRSVGIPALPHDLSHDAQGLERPAGTFRSGEGKKKTSTNYSVVKVPRNSATSWARWALVSGHTPLSSFPLWRGQRALGRNRAAGTPREYL